MYLITVWMNGSRWMSYMQLSTILDTHKLKDNKSSSASHKAFSYLFEQSRAEWSMKQHH